MIAMSSILITKLSYYETMISKNIKTLRKENSLTQTKLAEKVGVTRSVVNAWEQGIGVPNVRVLPKLKEALNCSYEELLEGS